MVRFHRPRTKASLRAARRWPRVLAALTVFGLAGSTAAALLLANAPRPRTVFAPLPASLTPELEPEPERIVHPAGGAWHLPGPNGPVAIHSLLRVDRVLKYGQFVWNDAGVPPGKLWVRVDLERQMISVFRGGHEIGTAVILYGVDGRPTPTGEFKVLRKDRDYWSRSYDAPMPYTLMLTDDGVAIHGSDVRQGLGTHGCVGVPLAFARRVFEAAQVGDSVTVLAS